MISIQKRSNRKEDLPPLKNGDHLDQKTFHERYQAMGPDVRAELIGGIVYMSSPQKPRRGRYHLKLSSWVDAFEEGTAGTVGYVNTTQKLDENAEPQPDACLLLPDYGGQTWIDDDGYLAGAPDWLGEISDSTESIDLHAKKNDYEHAGVREYMVAAVRTQQVFWFVRRRGKFKELSPGADGIFRSEVFPGLWLDAEAFLNCNGKRLLSVLQQGLDSAEHAAFVAKLAKQRSPKSRG